MTTSASRGSVERDVLEVVLAGARDDDLGLVRHAHTQSRSANRRSRRAKFATCVRSRHDRASRRHQPRRARGRGHRAGPGVLRLAVRDLPPRAWSQHGLHRHGRPVHRALTRPQAAGGRGPSLRPRRGRPRGGPRRAARSRDPVAPEGSVDFSIPGATTSRSWTTATSSSPRPPPRCVRWAARSSSSAPRPAARCPRRACWSG